MLSEYAPEKTHSDIAIATSIFVIKKVKDHTKYCGGNTTVKRLTPLPVYVGGVDYVAKPTTIGQDFVRLAEKRLIKFDEKTKKSRDKPIWDILRRTGSELWVKYRAKVEKEQAERLAKLRKNNP